MKHIVINNYGYFLGLKSNRIIVKKGDEIINEYPLNRLKTIHIASPGITISSDLIFALSARGIKTFFNTYNNQTALHTLYEHKSVIVKQFQYASESNGRGCELARQIILGKIKNQRSTLLYASRKLSKDSFMDIIDKLDDLINALKNKVEINKNYILGIEGKAADIYFNGLKKLYLFPETFFMRTKRYSSEMTNISLNYGYAVLANFIYKSIINAGLDPYFGVLHSVRSGKPSLVLDIMEEYRSFIVDRNIIKMKGKLETVKKFETIKKEVAGEVIKSINKSVIYNGRSLSVESVIQRQIYKISAYLCGEKKYKSYIFRW